MATLPNPNPIPNQGLLEYSYSVDPSLPDINSSILSNTVYSQVNIADLGMTKSSNVDYVQSGDVVTYTVVIKNTGNISANNIFFKDTVPSGLNYISGTLKVNNVVTAGDPNLGVTLANISANGVTTVEFNVLVNTVPSVNPIQNEAVANYSYIYDPSTPNSQVNGVVSNKDNLNINEAIINGTTGGIVKTSDKQYVTKDEIVTYTIVIKNTGNTAANNVIVKDTIPAPTSFVSGSISVNGINNPSGNIQTGINVGTVLPNQVVTISFKVKVDTVPNPNTFSNQATTSFTFTTDPSVPDGKTAGGVSNTVTIPVNYATLNSGGTGFVKTGNVAEATIGDQITYTLVLNNTGNTNANNVVLKDTIPIGTSFVTSSVFVNGLNRPSDNPQTGINIGTIAPSEIVTIIFKVLVNQIPNPNPTENQAKVDYNYTINPSIPNGATVTDLSTIVKTLVNYAEIGTNNGGLVKTANVNYVDVGDQVVYTIALKNTGNADAENVIVYDTIPVETSLVSGSVLVNGAAVGSTPGTGINVGTMTPGQVVTVNFTVLVNTVPPGNILRNSADVGYTFNVDGVDRPYRNTSLENQVNVVYVDLDVVKVADKNYADLGEQITYTIKVTNVGNTATQTAFLKDTIPMGTSFVTGSVNIDGTNVQSANPITGIQLGAITPGQVKTVTFKVLVQSIPVTNPVINVANVDFSYLVNPSGPAKQGSGTGTSGGTEIKNANFNSSNGGFTKTQSSQYSTIGDTITYTLVMKNLGNVPAQNAVVVDTIPGNSSFVAGSVKVNGIASSENPNTGVSVGTINPGQVVTITFDVIVVSTLPTDIIENTGVINYNYQVDPSLPNVNKTDSSNKVTNKINVAIIDGATGGITKTSDKTYVTKGETVTYTISMKNTGNVVAKNVILKDTIPSGTTFIQNSFKLNGVTQPGVDITNPLGVGVSDIAPGETKIVEFKVMVDTVPNPNTLINQAVVNFVYTTDPSIPNGEAGGGISGPNTVYVNYGSFDKNQGGFDKKVDVGEATIGDIITYTLVLKNIGNVAVNNAIFTDTMPDGTKFVNASVIIDGVSKPTENPVTGINLGTVGAGQAVTIVFKVQVVSVPSTNPIKNEGKVTYTYTVDPTKPNGVTRTDLSTIVATTITYASISTTDGGFVKTADKNNVDLGSNVRYTLVLKNTGNVPAQNVILKDTLPDEVSYVSGTLTVNGIINSGSIENGVNLGSILPGGVVTVAFTVVVNSVPSGNILKNKATVDYSYLVNGSNVNVTNPSNEKSVNVIKGELTTSKLANKSYADLGEEVTYSIVIKNTGNVEAQSVYIKDTIPDGMAFVANSVQVNGITIQGANITLGYNIGNIAVGAVKTVSFRAIVTSIPATNPVTNKATTTFNYPIDPNQPLGKGGSNSESNGTEIKNANFDKLSGGFSKSADKLYATIGEEIKYTLTLTNLGNVNAVNTTLVDSLPDNVEFVEGSATVNGASVGGNPEIGIAVGTVVPGGSAVITFKVKVISLKPTDKVLNEAKVIYNYSVNPNEPLKTGENLSNQILSEIRYADIQLKKVGDSKVAYINNTVEYTLQVENKGNVEATNVFLLDTLADGVEFVTNSLEIDDVLKVGANITQGVTIPSVMAGTSKIVTFKVKFTKAPRGGVFTNIATANYEFTVDPSNPKVKGSRVSNSSDIIVSLYIPPDKEVNKPNVFCPLTIVNGQIARVTSKGNPICGPVKYSVEGICTPTEKTCIGEKIRKYKMWKQETVLSGLDLETTEIEELDSIKAELRYIRTERVKTPNTNGVPNYEGELLTGEKEIVEAIIHFTVRIITSDGEIVKKEFDKLFSSFIVINSEYLGTPLTSKGCVEDIEITSLCNGVITVTSTILTYLAPGDGSCGVQCVEDISGSMQCVGNSKLCPNISEFLSKDENLWKEFEIYSNTYYDEGTIGELLQVKGDIKVIDFKIIDTPLSISMSNEGLNLTSKKMLVNMILTIKVNYISGTDRGVVRRKTFEMPVGTYIVLTGKEKLCDYGEYKIKACIEDIFACNVEEKYLFTNTTIILKAIPCEPRNCNY